MRAPTKRTRRPTKKRSKRSLAQSVDPRLSIVPRTFELTFSFGEGDPSFLLRRRITLLKPGGLEANMQMLGGEYGGLYLVGMVQDQTGHGKWTLAGFGGLPMVDVSGIREIVEPQSIVSVVKST